jgi:hypothetical protein
VSPLFGSARKADRENAAAVLDGVSGNGGPPQAATGATGLQGVSALAGERPELTVAAAFAGGVVLAILARRLAR